MENKRRVFLIDDDEIHNFLCESVIRNEDFADDVVSFQWAEEALESLRSVVQDSPENFPEIIFLDINMPGMDGWEFIDQYKLFPEELTNNCLLFVLSSAVDKKDIMHAKNLVEVQDFFSKPLTTEILEIIQEMYLEK